MKKFKISINENKVDGLYVGYIARIYVHGWLGWSLITQVEDEDIEYVENRAAEIVDILENPNR